MVEAPAIAMKSRLKRTPPESARAGAEEDSSADIMVTDSGPETTMTKNGAVQESDTAVATATATTEGHKLHICPCSWGKATSYLGLRIHQGRKKCLREERQRPRIDYFLRKESSQSSEVRQLDTDHSLQYISTTVWEDANTEVTTTESEPPDPPRPAVERRLAGHRLHVKWPGAMDKKLWETINSDLALTLEQLQGTMAKKLERMGDKRWGKGSNHTGFQEATGHQAPHPRKETN